MASLRRALRRAFFLGLLLMLVAGCTDAEWAKRTAYGTQFRVTLYSGGTAVRQWVSTGRVHGEAQSDGWFFVDSKSGKFVRVSGDVTVEQH